MANRQASAVQKLSTFHDAMIVDLVAMFPELKTSGFWAALRALPDAEYLSWMFETNKQWARAIKFVPDAYAIHVDKREIVIFEVVHHHDVTEDKFERMVELAFALDEDAYSLALLRCDAFSTVAYPLMDTWVRCHTPAGGGVKNWKLHGLPSEPEAAHAPQ